MRTRYKGGLALGLSLLLSILYIIFIIIYRGCSPKKFWGSLENIRAWRKSKKFLGLSSFILGSGDLTQNHVSTPMNIVY